MASRYYNPEHRSCAASCASCPYLSLCVSEGVLDSDPDELDVLVEHVGPIHAGQHIVRQGDAFDSIALVRVGTLKSVCVDRDGREQTQSFHMPGDVLGLAAISEGVHPCSVIALDTVMLCRFSFPRVSEAALRMPSLQNKLFRLMSRDIGRTTGLTGNRTADERLAAFLLGMADRFERLGYSRDHWQLTMSRMDIASYLRLAPETVSRLFRRFQEEGLLAVEGRDVELVERHRLEAMASSAMAA